MPAVCTFLRELHKVPVYKIADYGKIKALKEAGADSFGVGSYISGASAIDMTMDIKEVNDKPVAKRGRLPGRVENENLKRIIGYFRGICTV